MKAIVYRKNGTPDQLRLTELPKPQPAPREVLIKVHAASINTADLHVLKGFPWIMRVLTSTQSPRNKTLGADVAGTVEAVGAKVTHFQPGDRVFGDLSGCGFGAFAEYCCAPEKVLAPLPQAIDFETAAAVPMASVTALQALRNKGQLQAGQSVAINGASGGVGSFAVQLAKAMGAEVTAICSARNAEQAQALGAAHIIDYAQHDFTANGKRYDLILGVNGFHPIEHYQRGLTPTGRYVAVGGAEKQMIQAMVKGPLKSRKKGQQLGTFMAKPNTEDLAIIADHLQAGTVVPAIDRVCALAELPEAMHYVREGHARGKVVVRVG